MPRCTHGVYDPHGDGAACTLCQTDYDGQTGRGVPRLGPRDLLSGFQIDSEARPRADAPEWVFNDAFLRRVLSASKETGRPKNIARWAACLYLYYRCSWDYRRIGEYLDTSAENIRFTLRSARMFAESLLPERTV